MPASATSISTRAADSPAVPSATSALIALTPVGATTVPTRVGLAPASPPPLDIKLPPNWHYDYKIVPIRDASVQASMNVAAYAGPVTGGRATIILLWGFPSIMAPPTRSSLLVTQASTPGTVEASLQAQALWGDGLRLLQGTVVDITCNMGHYGQRAFTVGGLPAVGEVFAASQCEGEPDTAGWFAGLNQFGGNFLFYVYFDPAPAYNSGRAEVQRILDTVTFRRPGPAPVGPPPTNTGPAVAPTMTPVQR
jgi:hypothetical protein